MKSWLRFFLGSLLGALVSAPAIAQNQPIISTAITEVSVLSGTGQVTFLDVTNVGANYSSAPTVTFSGGSPTTPATAVAFIDSTGKVTNVVITNPGLGYQSTPTVTFSAPIPPSGQLGVTATAVAFVGQPFITPLANESSGPIGTTIAITAVSTGTFPVSGYTDEFFVNGTSIGTAVTHPSSGQPASVAWAPPQPGAYFLTVTSTDGAHTATSLPVRYWAYGTQITNPNTNTIVPAGSSVVVQAAATPKPLSVGATGGSSYTSAPTVTFSGGGGSGASATATIAPRVTSIQVTNGGGGYILPPSVAITGGGTGAGATAAATIDGITGAVTSILITNSGTADYSATPTVTIGAPPLGGTQATATAVVSNSVVGFTGLVGGSGYTSAPTVAITGGGGSGATAVATVSSGAVNTVLLTAANAFVQRIDFYADGSKIGSDTTAPYSLIYTPTTTQLTHTVEVRAYDNNGNQISANGAATLTLTTVPPIGTPPTCVISSPANNAVLPIPGADIPIAVSAGSSAGLITKVEAYVDGALLGTSSTFPYSFTWHPTIVGNYSLVALAYDDKGNVVASSPATVTIGALPTVTLTAPVNGATVGLGTSTTLTAAANDSNVGGSIASVQFFANGVLVGSSSTPTSGNSYSVSWLPAASGSASITALAINALGLSSSSTAVSVTVTGGGGGGTGGTPPTVSLVSPATGASVFVNTPTTLTATATAATGTVTSVQFLANGVSVGTATAFPYTTTWTPTTTGTYSLTAVATDNSGNRATSTANSVTVSAGTSPTVTIANPASGSTVSVGSTQVIVATATPGAGTVTGVQFFANGISLGSATTAPYNMTWTPAGPGTVALTAVVTNSVGNQTTSAAVNVTVATVSPGAPTVSLTSPVAGSSATVGTVLTLAASASDADGTIASVKFFANGVLVSSLTTFPYTAQFTPPSPGTYVFTAQAIDNGGNLTTSSAVTVTVVGGAAPTVAITSPAAGGILGVNTPQTITASAASSTGFIASVQFLLNGVVLSTANAFPYSASWTPAAVGTYSLTARATDNTGNITDSAPIVVTVAAAAPPTVAVTSPLNNSGYIVGTTVNLAASAASSTGTITQVQFLVNGVLQGSAKTASPYTATWVPASAGNYTIIAQATDNFHNVATSAPVTVTIGENAPPTVALTSPTSGLSYPLGNQILVAASANDIDGKVASVQFFANGVSIGSSSTAPFSVGWKPASAGSYTLTAVATDDVGNITTSTAVTITVTSAGGPAVTIVNPVATQTYGVGNSIPFVASASGGNGPITQVQFFVNGAPIKTATVSPFNATWTPVVPGTYTLVAVATDSAGISANSPGLSITIRGNTPPTVALTSPTNNPRINAGTPVIFNASAADVDGTVVSVVFIVNGNVVGTSTAAPFSATWIPTAAGTYTVVAQATDNSGNIANSSVGTVTVLANQPPIVSFTTPANGAVVRAGAGTTLAVAASDPDGTIAGVQFFANGVAVGGAITTLTSGTYRTQWTPLAEGIYSLTAQAVDNSGAATNATITVKSVDASSSGGGDTVYTGSFFGLGENGKFSVISVGNKAAAFIGYSTVGAGKVYYYPGITVDASHGFTLTDSTGKVLLAGSVNDTAATITTLDGAPVTLIGILSFPTGASVATGYYTGSLGGRATSQLAAIVGPDGSITIVAIDGATRTAGSGAVDAAGNFRNIAALGGGVFNGKADPLTNFLSGTLTGPLAGSLMAAVESGVSFSDGFLRNLSSRGQVGTGNNVLVAGFVVGGTATKQVLIRAIGPSLTQFGITGALADPQLKLFGGVGGTAQVASNDNWGGDVAIFNASNTVGAFPLSPTSLDAVILAKLAPGNYTAQVSGVNNTSGLALVELYDVDNPTPYSSQKVMNISTRAVVGAGQSRLLAGFVVSGTTAKKVLVRAVGPTLGTPPFNVPGVLSDPYLRIIRNSDSLVIRENDNWEAGNDVTLVSDATAKAGAFPLATGGKDSAILITLPPGSYSAEVSGTGTATGIALVEVYEVP